MTKPRPLMIALIAAAAVATSGCSIFKRKTPKTPVLGERIAVLTSEERRRGRSGDWPARRWSLPERGRQHRMVAIGRQCGQVDGPCRARHRARRSVGRVRPGAGSSVTARLAAPPIVAGGRVYAIDTLGAVRAFDAQTGAPIWASQTPVDKGNERSLYGGGIAYDNGRIYATNGLGYVVALDASDRRHRVAGASRRAAARRADRRRRRALCDEPGQPDLFAQDSRRHDQLVARPPRSKSPACSARPRRRSGRARSSPASRRASSTPIATRTAGRCGRTRCSAPASAPACRACRTSTPTR